MLGDAFADRSLLDGEFDEFFLQPLHRRKAHRDAAIRLLRSFDYQLVRDLGELHRKIDVPVQLVWGEHDRFFPVKWAEEMVADFPNAQPRRHRGRRPLLPRRTPSRSRRTPCSRC